MKRILMAMCAFFAAGLIFSACSKNPVGPSMSSMSISANAASTTGTTTSTTASNGGDATSVSTQQTSTVSTQSGDTGVSSVEASTGVNSSISGVFAGANGGGSTLNVKLYSTLAAAQADKKTITISAATTPTFSLNYSGIAAATLWFMVNDSTTAHYMNVNVPSLPTSIKFGVTPAGGTDVVPSKALIAGTYSVVAVIVNSSDTVVGYGAGEVIVK
ncbi:MAG: hypothetical protein NTX32_01005 [Candidatus Firestonebacteria bacterium]|nr:hypothetical protein [Candidatus Firestonebacteria bacterium]